MAAERPVVIEARVNEYVGRAINPRVPWTAQEIARDAAECAAAGAALVHFHARGPRGEPAHDYETYRDTMAAIRAASDILIHPTLGMQGAGSDPAQRIAHILRLAREGLKPDVAPLDMACANLDAVDPATGAFLSEDAVYVNSTRTLKFLAAAMKGAGVIPYAQIWNLPSLRLALAFARIGAIDAPLFASLALTEGGNLAGHPGTVAGLQAYLQFFPASPTIHWTAVLAGGSIFPLIEHVVHAGGHICIGLGDHAYSELRQPGNAELVARVADAVRRCGYRVARPQEALALLAPRSTFPSPLPDIRT